MSKQLPRGFRNKNPGNIEWGSPWQGLAARTPNSDPRFCEFVDAASGIRAIAITLMTYFDKRKARDGSKIDTIREVIERWAPPIENHTNNYINHVSKLLDLAPNDESLDLHDYQTMRTFVEAIISQELGNPERYGAKRYDNINTWYPDDVIDEGLRRAGFAKPSKVINSATVTATGVAGLGVGQLIEIIDPVKTALNTSQADLTSGDYARIAFGAITLGVGVYMAYVAWRKHRAGAN